MRHSKIYVTLMSLVFIAFVVVFNALPRSTYSEVERRELAQLPEYKPGKIADGSMAREISAWYSDTEPFREEFMTMHMQLQGLLALHLPFDDDDEALTFHASDDDEPTEQQTEATDGVVGEIPEYHNAGGAEEVAKVANKGIIVIGKAPTARALMAFGGSASSGGSFASVVNKYKETFPDVNVYCMVIPNSVDFYLPEKAAKLSKPQIATINNIYQRLSGVKAVDVYTPLSQHVDEDIFLRTDHHWAPLGAYYAAQAFAKVAGVPFADLSTYTRKVTHGFVGTMYGYSKDIAVKQSPEDFVYYTPNGVDYNTTYIVYNLDKNMHVTSKGRPYKGKYFYHFADGNGGAYCTFMGGDSKITQVRTSTHNGRRLIILKDSFGNALPGYLFHSFEEIHVIDARYFTENMVNYVRDNNITDILFANNTFMVCSSLPASNYSRFLTQKNGNITAGSDSKADRSSKTSVDSSMTKEKAPTHEPQPDDTPTVSSEPEIQTE